MPNYETRKNRFPTSEIIVRSSREEPTLFGQFRTLKLRDSARLVQSGRFAFSLVTRSLAHICAGIAQHHEMSKLGRFPLGSHPRRIIGALIWFRMRCRGCLWYHEL